jgi:hypothetical protein
MLSRLCSLQPQRRLVFLFPSCSCAPGSPVTTAAEVEYNEVRILLPTIPERTTANLNKVLYSIGLVVDL